MSESYPVPGPYDLIGLIMNPNGSITRDPTRFPRVPATPVAVASKDLTVSLTNSTWMRLYVPAAALNGGISSQKLPLVVYFHGGGFVVGSVDSASVHDLCNRLAGKLNVVVASASYRQAPEYKLPSAYKDGVDALKFIRKSHDEEWIKSYADLSNVYLMGTNSGGNLAYHVGLISAQADRLSPLRIRGLIRPRVQVCLLPSEISFPPLHLRRLKCLD